MEKTMNRRLFKWSLIELPIFLNLNYKYINQNLWTFREIISDLKREFKREYGFITIYLDLEEWEHENIPLLHLLYVRTMEELNKARENERLAEKEGRDDEI